MSKNLLVIMNPVAGQKKANRYLCDILNIFCINGYKCNVQLTTTKLDGADLVGLYGKNKDLIVCIGGDGTLNQVIAGMRENNIMCPVGYIAGGSTNDFANGIGLSLSPQRACEDIVYGQKVNFDIGTFNDRPFCYVASFGAFTKTSYATPRDLKNSLGHMAYVLEGIKELSDLKAYNMTFEADGKKYFGKYLFGAICNSIRVGGGIIKFSKNTVDLNDGLFEVILIKKPENPTDFMQLILDLQSGKYTGKGFDFFTAKSVKIIQEESVEWSLDGERETANKEIFVENIHSGLCLMMKHKISNESLLKE